MNSTGVVLTVCALALICIWVWSSYFVIRASKYSREIRADFEELTTGQRVIQILLAPLIAAMFICFGVLRYMKDYAVLIKAHDRRVSKAIWFVPRVMVLSSNSTNFQPIREELTNSGLKGIYEVIDYETS